MWHWTRTFIAGATRNSGSRSGRPISPDFSPVFGCLDVAQALLPAALALVPTLAFDTVSRPRTGVETSLWTPDLMESRKQKA
jgi:hypothetical protein